MDEAAVKRLEELSVDTYNDLALLPQESAAASDYISGHLHDEAIALLGEGMEDWTEFDLLAALTGPI